MQEITLARKVQIITAHNSIPLDTVLAAAITLNKVLGENHVRDAIPALGYISGNRAVRSIEDNATWDNVSRFSSPTPSIFSEMSDASSSSVYSAAEMITVTEQFANMLVHDSTLKPLYERGMDDPAIGPERLTNNLRRLLKKFGKDLIQEERTPLDHLAAQFVLTKSRHVASLVRKHYDPVYAASMRDFLMSKETDILSDEGRRRRIEEILRKHDYQPETAIDSASESDDNEDDYTKAQESQLGSLEAVEAFIRESNAYERFKVQLQGFVAHQVHERNLPKPVQLRRRRTWHSIMHELCLHFKRLTWPHVQAGYNRLEWTCVSYYVSVKNASVANPWKDVRCTSVQRLERADYGGRLFPTPTTCSRE